MFRYCVRVLKSIALTGRPVLGDLPVQLTLSSNSNRITCMIINCSLHGYIRTCRFHVGTFFYCLFSFYPWGWPRCVSTILKIPFLPLSRTIGLLMQVCNLVHAHARLSYLALLWKNINNDTLNTSGVKCYNDRSMRLRIFSIIVKNYRSWCFLAALLRLTQS